MIRAARRSRSLGSFRSADPNRSGPVTPMPPIVAQEVSYRWIWRTRHGTPGCRSLDYMVRRATPGTPTPFHVYQSFAALEPRAPALSSDIEGGSLRSVFPL